MKNSIREAKRKTSYRFVVFKRVIDYVPTSEIKKTADYYKECIAWDLWAGTVNLNLEIQHILIFCDFLDSNVVPIGISAGERQFYRRTAERMVREGFLSRNILDQFEKSKSVRTSSNSEEMQSILSLAA